jgi:hypothetical protein
LYIVFTSIRSPTSRAHGLLPSPIYIPFISIPLPVVADTMFKLESCMKDMVWSLENSYLTPDQTDVCHVGPVVRITPNEVHLSDPENYDKIYYVGTKYWKSPEFYGSFGVDESTFGTFSNELHRVRRAALNPRFSRKVVLNLQDIVQSKVQKLCRKVADQLRANKPANIHNGFRAVSVDVITDYAFDNCYNLLDQKGFGMDYFAMMQALGPAIWVFNQFPLLRAAALNTPMWMAKRMGKAMGNFAQMKNVSTVTLQAQFLRGH